MTIKLPELSHLVKVDNEPGVSIFPRRRYRHGLVSVVVMITCRVTGCWSPASFSAVATSQSSPFFGMKAEKCKKNYNNNNNNNAIL